MPRSLTLSDLLKRLMSHGVIEKRNRGKGSEIILLKPTEPGSTQGPQHTVKDHGPGPRMGKGLVSSILRRFEIDPDDFWG
jgi:hypothetical protein